jgi:hypothetical protein
VNLEEANTKGIKSFVEVTDSSYPEMYSFCKRSVTSSVNSSFSSSSDGSIES